MLSKEDFMEIQTLVRRGVYQRDIAERLGVSPRGQTPTSGQLNHL